MEKLVEVTREVITENNLKGSRRDHRKEARKISQIEFDIKLVEIEARINALTQLLQEGEDAEDWWYEEEGELKAIEHEEEAHIICEPEQGLILGEEEEEGVDGIQGSHNFKTNEMFVNAGIDDGELPREGILEEIPSTGIMDESILTKEVDEDFGKEIKLLEEWLAKDKGNKRCKEFIKPNQAWFVDLDGELTYLEEKLLRTKVHTCHAQMKMEGDVVLKDTRVNVAAKHDRREIFEIQLNKNFKILMQKDIQRGKV